MGDLHGKFPDYGEDMEAIADALDAPLGAIVVAQLTYQLESIGVNCSSWNNTGPGCNDTIADGPPAGAWCTSVVARDNSTGSTTHGRNMDWDLPDSLLQYVFDVEAVRGGEIIYRGSTLAGFAGLFHGVSVGNASAPRFSSSMDARNRGGNAIKNLFRLITEGKHGTRTPAHNLRYVIENAKNYPEALSQLEENRLINQVYYIVGGSEGDGNIVERDHDKTHFAWPLPAKGDAAYPDWYRLKTNYDHSDDVPAADNRRTYGYQFMDEVGSTGHVDADVIWDKVMTRWPIYNPHTDITSVIKLDDGSMRTVVWME